MRNHDFDKKLKVKKHFNTEPAVFMGNVFQSMKSVVCS